MAGKNITYILFLLGIIIGSANGMAQVENNGNNAQLIDRVAAVVGNEIILYSEVQEHIRSEMITNNLNENSSDSELRQLLSEVLNAMIDDRLLLVKAAQDSIQIDQSIVNEDEKREYQLLRSQFRTDAEYEQALQEFGMSDQQIRRMLREMMQKNQLQQIIMQTVSRGISITPQDMEAWVEANADSIGEMPAEYRLSHILLYPQVTEKRKEEIKGKLVDIRQQIVDGADFGELAEQYSEDTGSKSSGGDLGYFTRDEMVKEFADAAFALSAGQLSEIVESQFGYHLIRIEDIRGDEVRARHILLMLQPNEEDNEANIDLLNSIREDILAGNATFEDMARQYSEDENSKELGGRLQWLQREEALPEFMEQADKLDVGGISEPFETMYGYHILRLDNVKPAHKLNVVDDNNIVRQMVQSEKSMAELERILAELREDTYIRVFLD